MSSTGGFRPAPETYGGGPGALEALYASVASARGSAYSAKSSSLVDAENEAVARVLFIAWQQTKRFRNQFDPLRTTDFLARWEAIFALRPLPGATDGARRAALAARWALFGVTATRQEITDRLRAALGAILVSVYALAPAATIVFWPGDGSATPDLPWYSGAAVLRLELAWPPSLSAGDFYAAVARIFPILDALLPAWADWSWHVVSLANGPGFWLGDARNLGVEAFE